MQLSLFLSQRLDELARTLSNSQDQVLAPSLILVPHGEMKRWLLWELARRSPNQSILGIRIVSISEGIRLLLGERFAFPSFTQLFLFLCTRTPTPDLADYFANDPMDRKRVQWSAQLATQWLDEGAEGDDLPWPLPTQILPNESPEWDGAIHCFCIDPLPDATWAFLSRHPQASFYLFSPCQEFWSDFCSNRERQRIQKYWQRKRVSEEARSQLALYLKESHPLLGNWGEVGRRTLAFFDAFDCDLNESYPHPESNSLLATLQRDLLFLEKPETWPTDSSLQIVLAGASPLRELEILKDNILRANLLFSEIAVVTPDLNRYMPFLSLVFEDPEHPIPYLLAGGDERETSAFFQGIRQLLTISEGRWDADDLIALCHNRSFLRKQNWSERDSEQIIDWIRSAEIRWGYERPAHSGSWTRGFEILLDRVVSYRPGEPGIEGDQIDLLSHFLELFHTLRDRLHPLKENHSPQQWALLLNALAHDYFFLSPREKEPLYNFLEQLRKAAESPVSLEPIRYLLERLFRMEKRSSLLNAVRICSIEEGMIFPVKALFCIGMDEESFPRREREAEDRALFLQAILSAQQLCSISYCHLSEEATALAPSLVVQELLAYVPAPQIRHEALPFHPAYFDPEKPALRTFSQRAFQAVHALHTPARISFSLPEKAAPTTSVSISDLRQLVNNPWKFYLRKGLGIYLEKQEDSPWGLFQLSPLERRLALRTPPGIFGEIEMAEQQQEELERSEALERFGLSAPQDLPITPFSIALPSGELVRITGTLNQAVPEGLVRSSGGFEKTLKMWPELLISQIALGSSQLFLTENQRPKKIEIDAPQQQLSLFLDYYFRALSAPAPLLSDWADAFLRKGPDELKKKISTHPFREDPYLDWLLSKTETLCANQLFDEWSGYLRTTFRALIELYPGRKK